MNLSTQSIESRIESRELRSLHPARAILIFLGLGIGFRLSFYQGIPILLELGLQPFEAFIVTFTVPLAILFALAFAAVQMEGNPMTLPALAERFRLRRFGWRQIGLMLGIYALSILFSLVLSPTRSWILQLSPWLMPNETFPALLNPMLQNSTLLETAVSWMGPDAPGNWSWAILTVILFLFNMFGEELYWRGVLLPRQELVHGSHTWLIHGLLWLLFHLPFYPWYVLFGLPSTLGLAYLAQKTQNTWLPLLLHTLFNATMLIIILSIIFG
ncbi:MAG: CPBP family intramembrane glutamic endopeptidase [Chloroflexota bacterium]